MPWIMLLFTLGLTILFGGGHYLVLGSSRIAKLLGIHPVIIGLTVVALGTSMPEFLVSLIAAIKNKPDVALGNIVGSNISNIALILGLTALIRPMQVNKQILKFDLPIVIAASFLFLGLGFNHIMSRLDGLILSVAFMFYLWLITKRSKKNSRENKYKTTEKRPGHNLLINSFFVVLGIAGLTIGANWMVGSATEISKRLGVPELILGLTIVALGTSLPELATCVVAALKKQGDIGIGNIVGSNLFNMLFIVGPVATIHQLPVAPDLITYNIPIMIGLTILLYPMLETGHTLSRGEGGILLISYILIVVWWVL